MEQVSVSGDIVTIAVKGGGTVIISASDVTDASSNSNGALFTITFNGTAAGNGSMSLANNDLFSASGSAISDISWYGGTVTVQ